MTGFEVTCKIGNKFVSYNCNKSELKNILCGVPQGSILGPLFFILYINDITNTSTWLDFILFADDTTILSSSNDIVSQIPLIKKKILGVSNCFKANNLSVNAKETNYMIMGTPKMTSMIDQTDIILDNTKLDRVTKTKLWGVIIDENF